MASCGNCNGSGKVSCDCTGGVRGAADDSCPACGGDGYHSCPSCRGSGRE